MSRFLSITAPHRLLMAACAVLAMTSATHAQSALNDGVQSDPSNFAEIINLPADANPTGDVGDPTGATLTQLNMDTGFDFQLGGPMLNRVYSFTEVNILDVNNNGFPSNANNINATYINCEVNLFVPPGPANSPADTGFVGNNSTIDVNSNLNMTGGLVGNLSTISGTANVTGGAFGNFTDFNGIINLDGPTVEVFGNSEITAGGVVDLIDGTIFGPFFVGAGGTLNLGADADIRFFEVEGVANVSGGLVNNNINVLNGGVLNMLEGASPGAANTTIQNGGTVNLTGGFLGSNTFVQDGGVLNATGGVFGTAFNNPPGLNVLSGGTVNFTGTDFALDGTPIDVTPGVPSVVIDRTMTLTGTLLDGETFSFDLSGTTGGMFFNFFPEGSIVTVNNVLLGDVNRDGTVNLLDVGPFVDLISSNQFQVEGDLNEDGVVNLLDIEPFIEALTNSP